mmetsp:Transcript_11520/g.47955  ORF Transcript_11520/g.47955 Transcript_11520/m.47955 type:complete len:84 (+) Transcript_11520:811-1062(+)
MIEIKKRGTEVLTDVSCFRKHSRLTKSIEVVSDSFEGESVVARHRMIYKAIWDELQVRMVKKTSTMRKPKATSDDQRVSSMCL